MSLASSSSLSAVEARPALAYEAPVSSVSWAAILAGAVASSALTFVLFGLGSALGLTSISPFSNQGASATTITVVAGLWIFLAQILSAGLGGYLAGRLRTVWTGIHTDESYFRDTAHGLLVWAVGVVISAVLVVSATSAIVGGGARLAGNAAGAAGSAASMAAGAVNPREITGYFSDSLLRPQTPSTNASPEDSRAEVGRILTASVTNGQIAPNDKTYLASLIASRTGISQADAEKRVDDTIAQAKDAAAKAEAKARQAADTARKAAAGAAFVAFLCMFFGAITASIAATMGGHHRDNL